MTDTGAPDRGGRPATPDGLVRPYVLNVGSNAYRRLAHRASGQRFTRGDRPAVDWTGDLGSGPSGEAWPPGVAETPATPLPAEESEGIPRADQRGTLLVAFGAGVVALAIVVGATLVMSGRSSGTCRTESCHQDVAWTSGGVKSPADAAASARNVVRRINPTTHWTTQPPAEPPGYGPVLGPPSSSPDPRPTKSSPAPTSPSPSPTPSPTSTSSPDPKPVQVSYALVRKHPHSFQGKFTIVNNGSTAINGWELAVVLPDDSVLTVWDGAFHTDGGTVYIDPSSSQQTIAPGASLTENFIAKGSTTTPTSCTFNGSAC